MTNALKTPPILIEQRDGSKFWYVDDWNEAPLPTRKDIQRKFGPGVYRLTDSSKEPAVVKWEIGEEIKPNPDFQERSQRRKEPEISVQEAVAQAMRSYQAPSSYAPPPPVAHASGATSAALNELRLSLHTLSGRLQSTEHSISTIVYELKQLPDRISDRVRDVVSTMADPEERLLSIADIADRIQTGRVAPESESGTDWASIIGGALGALKGGAPSPEAMQAMQQMPPQYAAPQMPQMPQPTAPAPAPVYAQAPRPAPAPAPAYAQAPAPINVPGLTAEKAQEIAHRAGLLGFTFEQAIQLAHAQGLTADELLELGSEYLEDDDGLEYFDELEKEGANGEISNANGTRPATSPTNGGPGGSPVG